MNSKQSVLVIDYANSAAISQKELWDLMRRGSGCVVIRNSHLHSDQEAFRSAVKELQDRGQAVTIES